MKLPSPYICDECGTQKKESNHWWLFANQTMLPNPVTSKRPSILQPVFLLLPWHKIDPDTPGLVHLCSESCATKALSKWMRSLRNGRDPAVSEPLPPDQIFICTECRLHGPNKGMGHSNPDCYYGDCVTSAPLQSANVPIPQTTSEESANVKEPEKCGAD